MLVEVGVEVEASPPVGTAASLLSPATTRPCRVAGPHLAMSQLSGTCSSPVVVVPAHGLAAGLYLGHALACLELRTISPLCLFSSGLSLPIFDIDIFIVITLNRRMLL